MICLRTLWDGMTAKKAKAKGLSVTKCMPLVHNECCECLKTTATQEFSAQWCFGYVGVGLMRQAVFVLFVAREAFLWLSLVTFLQQVTYWMQLLQLSVFLTEWFRMGLMSYPFFLLNVIESPLSMSLQIKCAMQKCFAFDVVNQAKATWKSGPFFR